MNFGEAPEARHKANREGGDWIVSPLRGWNCLCGLPRADALGYLLVAPTALTY